MQYGILIEKITEKNFPNNYFYAHIPTLGLTTHGKGINGAIAAAKDLINLWIEEKRMNNEYIPASSEIYYSVLELEEHAI
ncbi:MAG: hypothetical protein HW421_3565 [Ignavibacteria bacterium]|nr:hypothetical protein [Ignavibacteria bacterium]